MEYHMAAKSKRYFCPVSGKSMGSLFALRRHIRQLHPKEALAIDKNQPECERSSFQCGICHYRTLKKANLKRHMEYHMTSKRKPYVCPLCKKSTRTLDTLKEHVRKRHPAKALEIDSSFRIPDSVFFHFCAFCRMAFSTPDDKERHFENVHRDKMPKELSDLKCHISQTKMWAGLGETRSNLYRNSKGAKSMKQFHCDVCNTKLNNKTEIIDHMKNHFSRRRKFTCQRAHPSYRDCDRCNFQCGECHFKTSYKLNLKRHMEIHMTAKSKMYVCPECGKSLGSIRTLRGHVKQRHPAKALAIDKTFRIPDSVYFHFCEICRMAFSTPDDKERHLKYVHEDITPKDLRDYALSKQKERIRTSNLPAYGGYLCCSICSETVQSYPELQRHQNIHRGHTEVIERLNSLGINITANGVNSNNGSAQSIDQVQAIKSNSEKRSYSNTASTTSCSIILTKHNRFQCDKCDASFRALYRLKRHISQTHEKIRNCLCEFCGKLYSTLEIVRNHIRAKHEKIKPVNCDFCNKKVTSRTAINSHMQNHFGLQKKFTCEICGKVCLGFGSYKNHRQGHEGDFICKCGQKFRNRQTLTYHEKTKHGKNPFICTTCQKTFSNPTSLNIHERIHRDDKRHKCQTCRKSFVQHYSLTVHMRVHTQEKPFRCNKCDARYTQSYPLTLHKRKHHGL